MNCPHCGMPTHGKPAAATFDAWVARTVAEIGETIWNPGNERTRRAPRTGKCAAFSTDALSVVEASENGIRPAPEGVNPMVDLA